MQGVKEQDRLTRQ